MTNENRRILRKWYNTLAEVTAALTGKPGSRVHCKETGWWYSNVDGTIAPEKEYQDQIDSLDAQLEATNDSLDSALAEVSSLSDTVSALEATVTSLPAGPQGPPGNDGQSDFLRGQLTVPGEDFAPYYASVTGKMPLTGIRVSLDVPAGSEAAFFLRIFLATSVAEDNGASAVLRGEVFTACRFGYDTEFYVALYNNIDNADAGGSTGLLGRCAPSPDSAGCWVIKSPLNDDTVGWLAAYENGIPEGVFDFSFGFANILESRDFAVTVEEMHPGFSFDVPFRLNAEGTAGSGSKIDFYAALADGQNLFPNNTGVQIIKQAGTGVCTVSGILRCSVVNRTQAGGQFILELRTTIIFNDFSGRWKYTAETTSDTAEIETASFATDSHLVHLWAIGGNSLDGAAFVDSSMTVNKATTFT